jgi:uncharacterized protein CbrC (UPF0167 family)
MQLEFKYFPDYLQWARFADQPCDCPQQEPCLDGLCFGDIAVPDSVCLSDLVLGTIRVEVGDHLKRDLTESIRSSFPEWSDTQIAEHAIQVIDLLSRTPPVPWVQENNWPVCHGDFCRYIGEWSQEQITEASSDGSGLAYLMSILYEVDRMPIGDPEGLWASIATGWTTVFMFECLTCNGRIAVEQNF